MKKILSWNVNGIRAVMRKDFEQQLTDLNPDILCLQETKAQDPQIQSALFGINGYHIYSNSAERKGYSGVAILTKEQPISVQNDIGKAEHDREGRVITAEYDNYFVVNVYVPNAGSGLKRLDYKEKWNKDFNEFIHHLEKEKPVILCGDLNVCHRAIDIARAKQNYNKSAGYTQKEIEGMDNLLNDKFIDTFRYFHPDEVKYSWWSYRANARDKNIGWRLDYCIVSEKLLEQIQSAFINNKIMGSDHCPVGIELKT